MSRAWEHVSPADVVVVTIPTDYRVSAMLES
jgi:hypothetical protein